LLADALDRQGAVQSPFRISGSRGQLNRYLYGLASNMLLMKSGWLPQFAVSAQQNSAQQAIRIDERAI
jgi:hypothetical protein